MLLDASRFQNMTRVWFLTAIASVAGAADRNDIRQVSEVQGPNRSGQDLHSLISAVQQLRAEVQDLKLQIVRLRLKNGADLIARLQHELEQVRLERTHLDEEGVAINQESAELHSQLAQPNLTNEERRDISNARADLLLTRAKEIDVKKLTNVQQEAQLQQQLERAKHDTHMLVVAEKQLLAATH